MHLTISMSELLRRPTNFFLHLPLKKHRMIALRLVVIIGLMLNSAEAEERCAFIRPIPRKEEPFKIHIEDTPKVGTLISSDCR